MLAIRLPETIEKRLERLAKRTGRTKTYYAREAILRHLDDLEDIYLAEKALQAIRSGRSTDYSTRKSNAALWLDSQTQTLRAAVILSEVKYLCIRSQRQEYRGPSLRSG